MVPHPVVPTQGEDTCLEWEQLDAETRAASARAMEVYAGMVDRMDHNIGRVVDFLKQRGEYDNTMILFMSDNGAEGASYEAAPIMGAKIVDHVYKYYDNSLDNIGRGNSFVWYGSRWAQAATAPSRLYKMFSTEGGCRVPLVVKPPRGLVVEAGAGAEGAYLSHAFCTVMDVMPTLLDLAGVEHPGTEYEGRPIAGLRGRSWRPFLASLGSQATGPPPRIHADDYVVGFEVCGSGALRQGDWKITYVPKPKGPQRWELFNVRDDPGETRDLSEVQVEKFRLLLGLWEEYKTEVGVVGVAGELEAISQGARAAIDEMDDPYAWIKYIGRPEITPAALAKVVPAA